MGFLKDLSETTLFYLRDPDSSLKQVLLLFTGSTILIIFARAVFFGLTTTEAFASLLGGLLAVLAQLAGALICLLGPRSHTFNQDLIRCCRVIGAVWVITLILFFPNFFSALRWVESAAGDWQVAVLHAFGAVAVLAVRTFWVHRPAWSANPGRFVGLTVLLMAIFGTLDAAMFYLFVIDSGASEQIQEATMQIGILIKAMSGL